ncbi:hypothetical protein Tco_0605804, partial [Tanacetum coccineum]
MSSPNHPTSDIEDASSSNFPDYIPASPDYFPASPGNTFESSNNSSDFFPPEEISPPKDAEIPVESPIPVSPSSSVGSSLPVRSTTPPPDYPFDESIFAEMPLKRTSTSAAPAMTQTAIRQLIADSVAAALEAQAATLATTDNTNRNSRPRETPVTRKCSYKEYELPTFLLQCNCAEENKVKFAISTLTKEALFWWNSFAQPIGIEESNKITWSEFKRLLIKKYCPQTEIKKMEEAIT